MKKQEEAKARKNQHKDLNAKYRAMKKENEKRWQNAKIYPKAEPEKPYVKPREGGNVGWYKTEPGIEFGSQVGRGSQNKVDWHLKYSLIVDGTQEKQPTLKFPFSRHKGTGSNISQVHSGLFYFNGSFIQRCININ